jgi:DNA anti-recombination protein RmuC
MARSERHWQKIEAHLKKWAIELDNAKLDADAEVAKVQGQYYQRLAELRYEIDQSVKRWDAELKELTRRIGTPESETARRLAELGSRVQVELTEWQPEIEQLKATAAKIKAEARRAARELRANTKERLRVLGRTAGESWDEIKPAMEKAWAELRPALRSAIGKFRKTR